MIFTFLFQNQIICSYIFLPSVLLEYQKHNILITHMNHFMNTQINKYFYYFIKYFIISINYLSSIRIEESGYCGGELCISQ